MFRLTFDAGKSASFDLTPEQVSTLISHEAVLANLLEIGLINKLKDSYASVTREGFADELEWRQAQRARAELTLGALMNGDVRASAKPRVPKADDFTNFARKHVLSLLSKEKRKELAESADKGIAYLDAVFAKNEAKLRPIVQKTLDEAIAAAKAKAEIAAELDLDI